MSESVVRRCDFKIQERRKYRICGARVPGDRPVLIVALEIYEMDLCEKHQLLLDQALSPFLDIAVQGGTSSLGKAIRKALVSLGGAPSQTDIRVWAQENGYDVAPTGSLKKDVIAAYNEAHA